jgi:hypothetical protein
MFSLHVPPVVKVSHLFSIEVRYSWQVSPLFKAHFLQQAETRLITFQDDGKEMPDLQRRTSRQRMLHQGGPNPLAMVVQCNVITDLCRKAERCSTWPIGAQTAPARHLSLHFRHEDGMCLRTMFLKPSPSVLHSQRLHISRGLLRRYGLVVNIHECRKIIHLCETNYHFLGARDGEDNLVEAKYQPLSG